MTETRHVVRRRRSRRAVGATLLILAPLLLAAHARDETRARASVPLPLSLQGLWGPGRDGVVEDCENKTGHDYKGFLSVSRNAVEYWEEHGTPVNVRRASASRYDVDLDVINSDAMMWTQRTDFTLVDKGRGLIVRVAEVSNAARMPGEERQYGPMTEADVPKTGSERRYVRCPDRRKRSS